jgi:hypothetical protein
MKLKASLICGMIILGGCIPNYRESGPCAGWHRNPVACERAAENSKLIGSVNLGQSLEEVQQIMGTAPDRRKVNDEIETWSYHTSYSNRGYTSIIFKDGRVTEIK